MMNDTERDRLIARYLGRRMSPAEEREFLRLAERDETLGGMIAAERVVAETLRRDRDALPTDDREMRSHLIAALGALPHGSGADPMPASKGGAPAGALMKGATALVLAGALAVGYLAMGRSAESPRRAAQAASAEPVRREGGSSSAAPAPAIPSGRSAAPASASTNASAPAISRSKQGEEGIAQPSASLPAQRHARNAAPANPASSSSPATAPASASAATASGTSSVATVVTPPAVAHQEPSVQPRREEPSLRTRDTMSLNVSINLERVRKKR